MNIRSRTNIRNNKNHKNDLSLNLEEYENDAIEREQNASITNLSKINPNEVKVGNTGIFTVNNSFISGFQPSKQQKNE